MLAVAYLTSFAGQRTAELYVRGCRSSKALTNRPGSCDTSGVPGWHGLHGCMPCWLTYLKHHILCSCRKPDLQAQHAHNTCNIRSRMSGRQCVCAFLLRVLHAFES